MAVIAAPQAHLRRRPLHFPAECSDSIFLGLALFYRFVSIFSAHKIRLPKFFMR